MLAMAACLVIGVMVWVLWPTEVQDDTSVVAGDPTPHAGLPKPVTVGDRWTITPTGEATFKVVSTKRVLLERGEVFVQSASGDSNITIETPAGEAFASGTEFYVGYHETSSEEPNTKGTPMKPLTLTRVLVLAGAVTLTNTHGTVEGKANELLAAKPDSAPTKLVVRANSDFAVDLYHQLAKENNGENLFFSPYSISSALAMTAEGARGETAEQMGRVLRYPKEIKRIGKDAQLIPWRTSMIHTGMAQLNKRFNSDKDPALVKAVNAKADALRKQIDDNTARQKKLMDSRKWKEWQAARADEKKLVDQLNDELSKINQYEIRVANALWGEQSYPFKKEYFNTISRHYKTGGVFPVDFRNNYNQVRTRINGWVEDQTNNRIKDLIPDGALDRLTRLVLVNAIYFKGDWSVPFKEKNTKDLDFVLSSGSKVKKPIMIAHGMKGASYADFNADGSFFNTPAMVDLRKKAKTKPGKGGFALLELPYKGEELSMVLIAPNEPTKLAVIEEKMTQEKLSAWIGSLKDRKVHVYMPKFKSETNYTLGDSNEPATLQKMGMVRAFVDPRKPDGAVFDGMSHATDPQNKLYITNVLHKAFVEVNEKGTEAAAATAVIMGAAASAPIKVPFTPTFKADRPFIYLIRDRATGSILFMGRMMEPKV